jgi:ABC-2 type transport system ATP-binding protein
MISRDLADRIAVLAAGRVVATATSDEVGGRDRATTRIRFRASDGVAGLPVPARSDGESYLLEADGPVPVLHALPGWAMDAGVPLEG